MTTPRTAKMAILLVASAALADGDRTAAQSLIGAQGVCTPQTLGPAVLDVPSVTVQPRFRLNRKTFPGAAAGAAVFTLWASEPNAFFAGPQLVLGETHLPAHTVRVIPGVYDVYYSWISGSDVPRNHLTRVLQGVRIGADRELTIDVPMIRVAGLKHHNGSPFGYDGVAALSLRGVDWPGEIPLGGAQPSEFQVAIIPGRYTFEYDWQQGVPFPNNRHAVVREINLLAPTGRLVLNVPSVIQSFEFLHNGAPFPNSLIERGDFVLRRGTREEVFVGSSHESSHAIRLIPGSYDVHWRHVAGANVPGNRFARVKKGLAANGALRVIDVPSLEVSGDILLDGQPPPASEIENARLSLVVKATGDRVVLGQTQWGAYQKRVLPGVYDIRYEHLSGGSIMPYNPRATLARGWRVQDGPIRTIDIPVGTYKGSFLLNGGSFPPGAIVSGQVYAVPLDTDQDPVYLGQTYYGGFDRQLIPGLYRAAYAHVAGAVQVPQNLLTAFGPTRRVRQGAETTGDLDVLAGPLEVSYRHNGASLSQGGPGNVRVHLMRDLNYLQLDDSIEGVRELMAMEGRFDLFYEYRGGPDLPANAFMRFGCWDLTR
jgi:hypothetical protein